MNAAKKPSRQDILKRRQQSSFVGREEQLQAFRDNLTKDPEEWCFLFNVSGQGGVGKSTLLDQFRKIAKSKGFATAKSYEADTTVPEAMGRLVEELEVSGYPLKTFTERYTVYRQKKEELETDPEAPQGFSAFVGKSIAKAGLGLAKQVPGSGAVTPFIDEDAFTTQAGEWTSYVTKKLRNKDEVQLVQEPVEVLTPLFLQDLEKVTQKIHLVLFFDTYERTSKFLDPWLRDILQGNYGDLPAPVIFVIAGRTELNRNNWTVYDSAIVRFSLNPFTDTEAQQFLNRKGITNPKVIKIILKLSGYLPLLVATLAENSPQDPNQIGDRCDLAVERFLKWETDPERRQIALDAALPTVLNRDILAQLSEPENADKHFEWLRHKPFVRQGAEGWEYHEVVRTQMLRYKRKVSPQSWSTVHGKLADYYEKLQRDLQLDESQHWREPTWQQYALHILYHHLCKTPQKYLVTALNNFLAALKADRKFAKPFAEVMVQVGRVTEYPQIKAYSVLFIEGLEAYEAERYADSLKMLTTLINNAPAHSKLHSTALALRGDTYRLLGQYENALEDLNYAVQLEPTDKVAIGCRGIIYKLVGQYENALEDLNCAIQPNLKDQRTIIALACRGDTYRLMGQYEAAVADFNRAIELNSEYTWAIARRGDTYRLMEQYKKALEDFNQAIMLDPEYKFAIANRGLTYQLIEQYDKALKDFNHAIALDSEYKFAIAYRGLLYGMMKQYHKSVVDFDNAIKLGHIDKMIFGFRGSAYQSMGQYEAALEDFNRAIELDSEYKESITSRGKTYQLMGQYNQAIEDFDHAISLDNQDIFSIASRGENYRFIKQYETALKDFDIAIKLDSKNDWHFYSRAITYLLLKQTDDAKTDFEKAIQLAQPEYEKNPQNWRNTFNLALYHLASNSREQAEILYKQAYRQGASIESIREAIQDLKDLLTIFPDHQLAKKFKKALEKGLEKRLNQQEV